MNRDLFLEKITASFDITPICAILGPRQCGKTTLARQYVAAHQGDVLFFDLEDPLDLAKLENPKLLLENVKGLVVIDEIQLRPDLFPILRVLVDQGKTQFLILYPFLKIPVNTLSSISRSSCTFVYTAVPQFQLPFT